VTYRRLRKCLQSRDPFADACASFGWMSHDPTYSMSGCLSTHTPGKAVVAMQMDPRRRVRMARRIAGHAATATATAVAMPFRRTDLLRTSLCRRSRATDATVFGLMASEAAHIKLSCRLHSSAAPGVHTVREVRYLYAF